MEGVVSALVDDADQSELQLTAGPLLARDLELCGRSADDQLARRLPRKEKADGDGRQQTKPSGSEKARAVVSLPRTWDRVRLS